MRKSALKRFCSICSGNLEHVFWCHTELRLHPISLIHDIPCRSHRYSHSSRRSGACIRNHERGQGQELGNGQLEIGNVHTIQTTKSYLPTHSFRFLRHRHSLGGSPHVRDRGRGRGQVLGLQRQRPAGDREHDRSEPTCGCDRCCEGPLREQTESKVGREGVGERLRAQCV